MGLAVGCASDAPRTTEPPDDGPKPGLHPSAFYSPAVFCLKGRQGEDTLLVLNQGDSDLVWNPIRVPDGIHGLYDEIRLAPGEATLVPWTWIAVLAPPFTDTVLVKTNDHDRPEIRIVLENVASSPPPLTAPPPPLLGFPPDSAVFAPGDSVITLVWQEVGGCAPAEYRVEIAEDAAFARPVFWSDFVSGDSVELLIDRPNDLGRVWWRVSPRWVDGILGRPSAARTWLVE